MGVSPYPLTPLTPTINPQPAYLNPRYTHVLKAMSKEHEVENFTSYSESPYTPFYGDIGHLSPQTNAGVNQVSMPPTPFPTPPPPPKAEGCSDSSYTPFKATNSPQP